MTGIPVLDGIPLTTLATIGIGLSSLLVAFLVYLRGKKADDEAQETAEQTLTAEIYRGLIERTQAESKNKTEEITELRRRIEIAEQRCEQRIALAEQRLAAAEERITVLLDKAKGKL